MFIIRVSVIGVKKIVYANWLVLNWWLAKKIENVAESLGLPCIAGTEIEPGFSLIAKLHLAASMKIHPLASEFTELSLLKKNILKHKIEIINGCVKVPDKPGFGVDLDEGKLNECKYNRL